MADFAASKGRPLFDFAVTDSVNSSMMASSIFGCTSPEQVDGVVEAALQPVPWDVMDEFYDTFDDHVRCLAPAQHFYWFKAQKSHNVEWEEMAVYPRDAFAHALAIK